MHTAVCTLPQQTTHHTAGLTTTAPLSFSSQPTHELLARSGPSDSCTSIGVFSGGFLSVPNSGRLCSESDCIIQCSLLCIWTRIPFLLCLFLSVLLLLCETADSHFHVCLTLCVCVCVRQSHGQHTPRHLFIGTGGGTRRNLRQARRCRFPFTPRRRPRCRVAAVRVPAAADVSSRHAGAYHGSLLLCNRTVVLCFAVSPLCCATGGGRSLTRGRGGAGCRRR